MYLLAGAETTVSCSCARAFAYAADLENFADWFPGVLGITPHNDLPFDEPGKQYLETVAVPLRGRRRVLIRVEEASPPRRLVTEGNMPFLLPRMEIGFESTGPETCTIHWRMFCRTDSPAVRLIALPLARRTMRRRADAALRNLARRLDGAA
ncbi:SRPBCC family protein [Nocardia amikacinitolerans]|uniref:SRPBCC family protein n=1 Tax=Nocardia amikacinitolerans TaxID=756689 RepID=UPI0020A3C0D0|nr:SRPBCC family protein [Nocardia amikacinitolerans]MCP2292122.1 Polyketide cyclase / dehydrase and lipid transport [Nocardia amikacinitolerans]